MVCCDLLLQACCFVPVPPIYQNLPLSIWLVFHFVACCLYVWLVGQPPVVCMHIILATTVHGIGQRTRVF